MGSKRNGRLSLFTQLLLSWGKIRRFYYSHFGNGYVTERLRRRRGQCLRCGACCKLVINCPFLDESTNPVRCKIHGRRFANCRIFPLDERDLAERDKIMPDRPCGYYFVDDPDAEEEKETPQEPSQDAAAGE